MLRDYRVHPSLATSDVARAKAWYEEKLGWTPKEEYPAGLLVYDVEGSLVTVFESPNAGTAKNTVAAWKVDDLRSEVARLRARGLQFEDLDMGDDLRTEDGIATDPEGNLNAWFRDSDGNWITMVEEHVPADEIQPEPGVGLMVAASDLARAKRWYTERLGLTPYKEWDGELVIFVDGKTRFSLYTTPSAGTAKNTVGMWWVDDLRAEMADLRGRGVVFEEYDFGEYGKTVDGVMSDSDGSMTAWFTDSEGNVLGLAQNPA